MTNLSAVLGLDHVVIAVHDLDRSSDDYRALGFTVQPGGQHPGRTSHNALIVFEDGAYFELIAWQASAPEERWWRVLQGHGEGLVDFALLPLETTAAIAAARARGLIDLIGPVDGGRVRPDGQVLQWQSARQTRHDLPFLCGDVTPRHLRVPEGEMRVHPNGVRGIAALQIAVLDLAISVERYRALLGPVTPVTARHTEPDDNAVQAGLVLGTTAYTLASPRAESSPNSSLRLHLSTRGEGPCQIGLLGPAAAPRRTLDRALTHGAAIEIG